MQKQYIKLNDNDSHLSLGNLFRVIKEFSVNKRSAMQSELFVTLFEVESVNDTTINNYCVGIRTIGDSYKQIYLNKQKRFNKDESIFEPIIINLLSIMDGNVYIVNDKRTFINNSDTLYKLVNKLFNIAKNDNEVNIELINELNNYIKENDYYLAMVKILFFIILDKTQPIYESELKTKIIESILSDTSISSNDLKEYLSLTLREGINYDFTMKKLANSGNAYACYNLGIEECLGHITGTSRPEVAVSYFKVGAKQNHAGCNYMLGYMTTRNLLGEPTNSDLELAYSYLTKALELGNVAASNSIGLMYLRGTCPLKKNKEEAIKYFKKAASANFVYAINNLGKIEEENSMEEAVNKYYKVSADLGESWACNKVGEFYRKNNNNELAFEYYNKGLTANYKNIYQYNYYNLAKYYYSCGSLELGIKKDLDKCIELYKKSDSLIESLIELFLIYIDKYLKTKDELLYKEINEVKVKIENHEKYTNDIKLTIEDKMKSLVNNNSIDLNIIGK